jgi:hypothetical protein
MKLHSLAHCYSYQGQLSAEAHMLTPIKLCLFDSTEKATYCEFVLFTLSIA